MSGWRQSGQGQPNFFPHFCSNNPVHVLLFYIMRDARDNGESDLALCVESQMDVEVQVNSMPTTTTASDLESITSAGKDTDCDSVTSGKRKRGNSPLALVNSTLRKLTHVLKDISKTPDEETMKKNRQSPSELEALIAKKIRLKKLKAELGDDDSDAEALDSELEQVKREIRRSKKRPRLPPPQPRSPAGVATPPPASRGAVTPPPAAGVVTPPPAAGAGTPPPAASAQMKEKVPMWLTFVKNHTSLCAMMDVVPLSNFKENSMYDDGFEGEKSWECTPQKKKMIWQHIQQTFKELCPPELLPHCW